TICHLVRYYGSISIRWTSESIKHSSSPLKRIKKERDKEGFFMSELLGRRFHRLFGADGRSVVIAMDHSITDGALAGFENPEKVLEQVIAGGADAILTSIGIARHFSKQFKDIGLLIRCDGATSPLLERPRELIIGVEGILTTGADAAAAM